MTIPNDGPGPENRDGADRQARPRGRDGPEATYAQTDRLSSILREISGLLDGSLRCVGLAERKLTAEALYEIAGASEVQRQLQNAAEGLERVAELVHSAMQGPGHSLGSTMLAKSRPVTLGEAVHHAVDVLTPQATERGARLFVHIPPPVAALPAGTLYTVVLNGVQNAVEAVGRRGMGGTVEISIRPDGPPNGVGYGRDGRTWYLLEVTDDGVGPPAEASRAFDLGFTTKRQGAGVGLAVARSVIQGLGGTIELTSRQSGAGGRGAVLKVRFPSTAGGAGQLRLGGAA